MWQHQTYNNCHQRQPNKQSNACKPSSAAKCGDLKLQIHYNMLILARVHIYVNQYSTLRLEPKSEKKDTD